jgi:peroxiredoxin
MRPAVRHWGTASGRCFVWEQAIVFLIAREHKRWTFYFASALSIAIIAAGCVAPSRQSRSLAVPPGPSEPNFVTEAVAGEELSSASARGKYVALFFFCGCRLCCDTAVHLDRLRPGLRKGVIWGISELNPADVRSFSHATGVRFPLASDANARIRQAYGVEHCPAVVLMDPKGHPCERWDSGGADNPISLVDSVLWRVLKTSGLGERARG